MTSTTHCRARGAARREGVRKAMTLAAAGFVAGSLSGCLGPTYGTGKSQGETLFDDLDNIVSLGNKSDNKAATVAAAQPRPDLVKPDNTTILPPPQTSRVASGLPESPEQRSARLQAAAYQGSGPIPADVATARKEGVSDDYIDRQSNGASALAMLRRENADTTLSPQELRSRGALVQERLREQKQGNPDVRRYLSEPPVAYRKPAATAPVGDPGVDEDVKERRLRNDETLASKIRSILPF